MEQDGSIIGEAAKRFTWVSHEEATRSEEETRVKCWVPGILDDDADGAMVHRLRASESEDA